MWTKPRAPEAGINIHGLGRNMPTRHRAVAVEARFSPNHVALTRLMHSSVWLFPDVDNSR